MGKHFSAEAEAEVLNRPFIEAMQRDEKKQKETAAKLQRLEQAETELAALTLRCNDLEACVIQTAIVLGMDREKAFADWKSLPRWAEGAATQGRFRDLTNDLVAEQEAHRETRAKLESAQRLCGQLEEEIIEYMNRYFEEHSPLKREEVIKTGLFVDFVISEMKRKYGEDIDMIKEKEIPE